MKCSVILQIMFCYLKKYVLIVKKYMIKFDHTTKLDFMMYLYCFYSYTYMYLLAFEKYMILSTHNGDIQ